VGPGFEEGSFLGYLLAHSEEACSAAQGPASNPGPRVAVTAAPATLALDSGATTSCFKEGTDFRPLSQPITVRGHSLVLPSGAHGTTALPCPALPSGTMRGLHSPAFRHNLVSLGELQKRGIEVVFPAGTTEARCIDPKTGKIVWRFKQGPQGLYEAAVQNSENLSLAKRQKNYQCE